MWQLEQRPRRRALSHSSHPAPPSAGDSSKKVYVHMLNSTLCATERALCCLLENYQTKGGVKVPPVLVPYMGGVTFIPFVNPPPKPKKGAPAPAQFVPTKEQIAELSLPDPKVAAADGKEELQVMGRHATTTACSSYPTTTSTSPPPPPPCRRTWGS